MNRANLEVGILRFYYVAWVCWSLGLSVNFIYRLFLRPNLAEAGISFVLAVFAPPILMFAVRWIYRGFLPKATTV